MSVDKRESGLKLGLVRPTGSLGAIQRIAATWYANNIAAASEIIPVEAVANFFNIGDRTTGIRFLTKRQVKTIIGGQR